VCFVTQCVTGKAEKTPVVAAERDDLGRNQTSRTIPPVSLEKARRSSPRTRRESMARQIALEAVKANSTVLTLHSGPPEFGSK
jgi:hypothetical protein